MATQAETECGYGREDLQTGQRVELHPGTDRWMRGDRYATIQRVTTRGQRRYWLLFDKSNALKAFSASNVRPI